ncbi:hypothetical protein FH972_009739 [Carpinus fangiana]|uniref:Uncharacterized protein n=1 Tax=Carpinus fangiana TaxID=176857 RepID=A0A660KNW7_9ROSI|nr:hypothetical protein FH972_009739 [Carpinus fangiana]
MPIHSSAMQIFRRQGPLYEVSTLHSADPYQRIRHCRPPKTQGAPERARVHRRRTRARLLVGQHCVVVAVLPHRDQRSPARLRTGRMATATNTDVDNQDANLKHDEVNADEDK